MQYPIIGCDANGAPCTTTVLDVTSITQEVYGDPSIEDQRAAFEHGKIDFCRLNCEAIGLARSYGGESKQKGNWLHIRIFKANENPIEQLQLTATANTADNLSLARLPPGTRVAIGPIAGGKSDQVRVSSADIDMVIFEELTSREDR